jgi:hypothetical protein
MPTVEAKTTADAYVMPMEWRGVTASPPTVTITPKLMYTLNRSQEFVDAFSIPIVLTSPPNSISDDARTQLLSELAELSVDPDALDRDSEVDIWGFDTA